MPTFAATFVPNPAGIKHLLASPGGAVGRWLQILVREVEAVAKSNAPFVTGELRNSIVSSVIPAGVGLVGSVTATASYAIYVHQGTRPHEIHGNPILRFPARSGMIVFTPKVDHPGTKANPFLTDALVLVVGSR